MWRSDDDKQAPAQGGKGGTGKQEWDEDTASPAHGEKREPHDDRHGRQRGVGQRAESGGGARSRRRAATSVAHGLPAKRDRQYVRKFSRRVVADGHDVVRRCQNNGDDGKCRGPAAERRPECPIDRPAHPRRKCQIEEARRQDQPARSKQDRRCLDERHGDQEPQALGGHLIDQRTCTLREPQRNDYVRRVVGKREAETGPIRSERYDHQGDRDECKVAPVGVRPLRLGGVGRTVPQSASSGGRRQMAFSILTPL